MPYTLDQLSTMIDSLTTRVNQIDGTGLADPTLGSIPVLAAKYDGQRSDLINVILKLEQITQALQASVNTLQATLNHHLGVG
jgi:hypothetical protein